MEVTHEGSETTNTDSIERLRLILRREQQRPVSYEEAHDVGESLISFYETLASQEQIPEVVQMTISNSET